MAVCSSTTPACASAQRDDLRTIVELDRRRASVGIHYASDVTRASRVMGALWLAPDAAEKLARDILQAVQSWRADQAVTAWTSMQEGRRHG
ncbi:MAG: hypothetical protein AB7F22_33725 [Reyranella sp.]|uniref:hypothetical protein n=1 Tax=Reyranella sp. TaxID=1929291 RepID=UPI003D132B49